MLYIPLRRKEVVYTIFEDGDAIQIRRTSNDYEPHLIIRIPPKAVPLFNIRRYAEIRHQGIVLSVNLCHLEDCGWRIRLEAPRNKLIIKRLDYLSQIDPDILRRVEDTDNVGQDVMKRLSS